MSNPKNSIRRAAIAAALLAVTAGHASFWSWRNAPTAVDAEPGRIESVSYSPSGRSYDPNHQPIVPRKDIEKDMTAIAGFADGVRTYSTLGSQGEVPEIAVSKGLDVTLGIWLSKDKVRNEREVMHGIALAKEFRGIKRIVVGNETLLRAELTDAELAGYIKRVRAAVPASIKVGTADVWSEMVKADATVKASDFMGVHVLPYWEGVPVSDALTWIRDRLDTVRKAHPGKPLFVGEVGWPSGGENFHDAYPTPEAQAAVVRGFAAEANALGIHYNVVEAFDGIWKSTIEGSPGPTWGVLDADRQPKWSMTGAVAAPYGDRVGAGVALAVGLALSAFAVFRRRTNAGFALAASMGANIIGFAIGSAVAGAFAEYLTFGALTTWGSAFALGALMMSVAFADLVDVARRLLTGRAPALLPHAVPSIDHKPMVSIHVAACREQPDVLNATLASLSRLDYPNYEVVVLINNTEEEHLVRPVEEMCRALGPKFKFHWYKKISGFKAGALNAALRHTDPSAEIVAVLDADYTVSPDWLSKLAPTFADPSVGIVQAPQEHRDGHETALKAAMTAEYRPFFDVGMQEGVSSQAFICHGTMIMLRRSAMDQVGGWSEAGICEDTELGLRILSAGYRAAYTDERLGAGLAPDNFMQFRKQRDRWVFGSTQIVRAHWKKFLPGSAELSARQKLGYVTNWIRWWSDAVGLFAAAAAVVWTFASLVLPLHLPPVAATAAVLGALVLRAGSSLLASRYASGNSWKESLGACAVGMALSTTVALAVVRGLFRKQDAFRVTAKGGKRTAGRFCAKPEAWLSAALVASSATAALVNPLGTLSLELWSVLLAAMAVPNLMAVAFGIGDMLPVREAKPAPVPATQQADTANQEQGANRPVAA
ncbi:glycosyl transferase [Azospirillum sp. TSH7]|uniref:glycosyltransferase n=1 Tax=unclassified Azospirillum TaxID=2630922 RepID=UPI000D60E314|nr:MULTISPECIES: glycosyltransferase [unclassified Azospirillum]PWC62540.1 glycosyl transferase [Azospirillum sp. TSH20]PWC67542.1 glycosyl transferase [Azospirillum sp. TSH7]